MDSGDLEGGRPVAGAAAPGSFVAAGSDPGGSLAAAVR